MKLPLVTIIIPNFNYSKWLGECLDSAIAQDYPYKRIIVVDDCSTDNSWEVLEKYPDKVFPVGSLEFKSITGEKGGVPLTFIQLKENGGPSKARTAGIKIAQNTHLFYFLDADNTLEPTCISKCVAELIKDAEHIGVVYTDNSNVNLNSGIVNREFREPFDFARLLRHNMVFSNALVSGLALTKVGIYDENIRLAEDLDLWIRIGQHFILYHIPQSLVNCKVGEHSTTSKESMGKWQWAWNYISQKHQGLNV